MPNERQWLQAEQRGDDEEAMRMFADVMATLPRAQPSAVFVERTVQIAWRSRARRRLAMRLAYGAMGLLVGVIGVATIYELAPFVPTLIASGALAGSRGLVWLLTAPARGANWWWIAEKMGAAIAEVIAAPSTAIIIGALEMIGLGGIFLFRQLLRED